jgi:hypothetical protein
VASGHDLESLKDFLKRIDSNFRLSGRALRVCYENPWAILARRRPPGRAERGPELRNRKRTILGARPSPRSNRRK